MSLYHRQLIISSWRILQSVFLKCDQINAISFSVCARGLDVKKLVLVVNYDCPNHYEDYVHRYWILLLNMPTSFLDFLYLPKVGWSFSDICLEVIINGSTFHMVLFTKCTKSAVGSRFRSFFPCKCGSHFRFSEVLFSLCNIGGGLVFPSVHCAQSRPHREGGQRGVRLHLHHQGAGDWDVHHGDEQFLKYKRWWIFNK